MWEASDHMGAEAGPFAAQNTCQACLLTDSHAHTAVPAVLPFLLYLMYTPRAEGRDACSCQGHEGPVTAVSHARQDLCVTLRPALSLSRGLGVLVVCLSVCLRFKSCYACRRLPL